MQNHGSQKFTSKCENVKVTLFIYGNNYDRIYGNANGSTRAYQITHRRFKGVIIWQGTDNDLLTRTLRELENKVIGMDHGPGDSIGINDLEIQKKLY
ncbi:4369_t:CDS:2 [Entrophospora sp. SA101]|nr:4369_t:CDS:2 [Entrophospora sp. SA101]CAJ0837066.1 16228_t:CDS:2 [Entrophospora sp. SA101]